MAQLAPAIKKTLGYEGIYDDDPLDSGGETCFGVARAHHPGWSGWPLVDRCKALLAGGELAAGARQKALEAKLRTDKAIAAAVEQFYFREFWLPLRCPEMTDQYVAEELFDTAVNGGQVQAVKILQRALNLLNANQRLWADIVVDGKLGPVTTATLEEALRSSPRFLVYNVMNVLQGAFYCDLMERNPAKYERFRGWFKRVRIEQEG